MCEEGECSCEKGRHLFAGDGVVGAVAVVGGWPAAEASSPLPPSGRPGIVFIGRISPEKGVHVWPRPSIGSTSGSPMPDCPWSAPSLLPRGSSSTRSATTRPSPTSIECGADVANPTTCEQLGPAPVTDPDARRPLPPWDHSAPRLRLDPGDAVVEERFGMPTIEAMALDRAVVATRGGAFTEIVDKG